MLAWTLQLVKPRSHPTPPAKRMGHVAVPAAGAPDGWSGYSVSAKLAWSDIEGFLPGQS